MKYGDEDDDDDTDCRDYEIPEQEEPGMSKILWGSIVIFLIVLAFVIASLKN